MRTTILIFNLTLSLVLILIGNVPAQNHVLSLDGDGDYVRLPSDIFNELDEATVEGWVRWEELNTDARFFDFGTWGKSMLVSREGDTNNLVFTIWDENKDKHKGGMNSECKWKCM